MKIFEQLKMIQKNRGAVAVALIDPDTKYDGILLPLIKIVSLNH